MDIDLSWLDEFKEEENTFFKFYSKKVDFVNLVYIYSKQDEIVFLKTEKYNITNNTVRDNEIITLAKKNQKLNGINFTFKHICSYEFPVKPSEVKSYIAHDKPNTNTFFKSYGCIQDIQFKDTIELFQDLNTLYFIYGEGKTKKHSTTKKVYITHSNKKTRKK